MWFNIGISNFSLENIDRISQNLRELRPRNAEPATVAKDQLQCTTINVSATTYPVTKTTGRRTTNTNDHISTFNEEDDQEVIIFQATRPTAPPWPTTRTTSPTIHCNARSKRSSRQTSQSCLFRAVLSTKTSPKPTEAIRTIGEDLPMARSSLSWLIVVQISKSHFTLVLKEPGSLDYSSSYSPRNATIDLCRIATVDWKILPPLAKPRLFRAFIPSSTNCSWQWRKLPRKPLVVLCEHD